MNVKGKTQGMGRQGKGCKQLLGDLKEKRRHIAA